MRDLYDPNASYQAIEPSQAQEVRRISTSLMRTGSIANFRPLLLAARLKYPNDASLYRRLLTLCEIYAARVYVIGGLRSNTGQSSLFRAARELFEGSPPEAIESSIADSIRRYASDESVRAALDSRVEWYYRNGHKYVLYEYELGIVRSAGEVPPFGDLSNGGSKTTEHILPQNPSEGSAWWADFDRDTHRILVNSIGNLVLTRDNSSYSNKEYAAKRGVPLQESPRCYFSSSALARERELAQRFDHWTPETIEKRRQMIVVWALDRWSLSGSRRADPAHG